MAIVSDLRRIDHLDLRFEGRPPTFGCPMVIELLWERLGLKKTLVDVVQAQGLRAPYERALLAMTTNRLCDPESKLGIWDRWLSKVYLPSCDGLKLNHMYEAMDLLHTHADKIEEAIFFRVADFFDMDVGDRTRTGNTKGVQRHFAETPW